MGNEVKAVTSILIVDGDAEQAGLFQDGLEREGFKVTAVHDDLGGMKLALSGQYDLVILDTILPDINGCEILVRIRQESQIPILMLTSGDYDADCTIGLLEDGADDYLCKPCTPRELAVRTRALLRRAEAAVDKRAPDEPIDTGPLKIWSDKRKAVWLGKELELTSTEFDLLKTLALNVGRTVSKHELSEKALGRPLARFDRSIDMHISSIRQKLGHRNNGHSYIQTVHGKGYQLLRDHTWAVYSGNAFSSFGWHC